MVRVEKGDAWRMARTLRSWRRATRQTDGAGGAGGTAAADDAGSGGGHAVVAEHLPFRKHRRMDITRNAGPRVVAKMMAKRIVLGAVSMQASSCIVARKATSMRMIMPAMVLLSED